MMKLGEIWENSGDVAALLTAFASIVPAEDVRQRLMRESAVLQCQAVK
jgi:hypothetical protein